MRKNYLCGNLSHIWYMMSIWCLRWREAHTGPPHTHKHTCNAAGRTKARSLTTNNNTNTNTNTNNNNNKKEAGVFLDSAYGCCKKPLIEFDTYKFKSYFRNRDWNKHSRSRRAIEAVNFASQREKKTAPFKLRGESFGKRNRISYTTHECHNLLHAYMTCSSVVQIVQIS